MHNTVLNFKCCRTLGVDRAGFIWELPHDHIVLLGDLVDPSNVEDAQHADFEVQDKHLNECGERCASRK